MSDVAGFIDLLYKCFPGDQKYNYIVELIDYIAYGLEFSHNFWNSSKSAKTPKCVIVTPGYLHMLATCWICIDSLGCASYNECSASSKSYSKGTNNRRG